MACAFFQVPLTVFMVRGSYDQKPFRKAIIETFGAKILASPSDTTNVGRNILAKTPDSIGSLGIAISEAVEVAVTTPNCRYVLGSVLSQVLLHQSVIGLETKRALDTLGEYPDVIIGCAGGGSNLGGLIAPFAQDKVLGRKNPRLVAVEPASCPSFTRGKFAYDFCDTGKICPLAKMYTLGSGFIPGANHAGGLRYHGMSPILSQLYADGILEAVSVEQTRVFEAAVQFAQVEGILPAPESSHAIWATVQEALKAKEEGKQTTILFGLTGTGYFDMKAYAEYNGKVMTDIIPTDADIAAYIADLPAPPK
jgi:tryptophan synthase beta chain